MSKIKVVIDRAKWRSGADGTYRTGTGRTMLLNEDGCMCCLGFITKTVCPNVEIFAVADPSSLVFSVPELNQPLQCEETVFRYFNTDLAEQAIEINDAGSIPSAEKEQKLIELFKDSIYALEFVGHDYEAEE